MSQVPAAKTPFTPKELLAALSWAYRSQMGHEGAHHALAVLAGQVALETANGAACIAFNVGNVKRGPGPDWCSFSTFEYIGNPPVKTPMVCQFSAWPSLGDACQFFIAYLSEHWPEAWSGAVAGDVDAFALGLRKRGYYTAPEQLYAAGVRRWSAYYLGLLGGDDDATLPELPSPEDMAALATTGLLDGAEDALA
jgi:hypothetical protein